MTSCRSTKSVVVEDKWQQEIDSAVGYFLPWNSDYRARVTDEYIREWGTREVLMDKRKIDSLCTAIDSIQVLPRSTLFGGMRALVEIHRSEKHPEVYRFDHRQMIQFNDRVYERHDNFLAPFSKKNPFR